MSERGGGRARGRSRARSQAQPEPVRRPGEPTPQQQQQQPPAPPQQPQQQPRAAPQPPAGRVARGTAHGDVVARPGDGASQVKVSRSGNGNLAKRQRSSEPVSTDTALASTVSESLRLGDNGARGGGRGAWRGRDAPDPVTRPSHVKDKRGQSGTPTTIMANYFKMTSTPNWSIYQYHVDFKPAEAVEVTRMKRALMHSVSDALGVHLFDGTALYKMQRFEENEQILHAKKRSDDSDVQIHIKFIKELSPRDDIILQILGIQIRKAMRHLDFHQLQEYYYDRHSAQVIPNHNLELWPGFATAIHQHEESTMLCADLVFKILRQETVLDQLRTFANRNPQNYKGMAEKELMGCIILTRYNNRTYKLDEIAWDKKPTDRFEMKGTMTTFIEYYKQHWQIDIFDHQQPLLISLPKKRDINRGQTTPFLLIPELAVMTGISEETRGSFMIMKDIATHTRVGPDSRVARLGQFINRMLSEPKITEEMTGWGLSFSRDLITFPGRTLPPEKIYQAGGKVFSYDPRTADWTKEMRSNRLMQAVTVDRWAMLVTHRDMNLARDFQDSLCRVCPPMGIQLSRPELVTVGSERVFDYMQALESVSRPGIQLVVVIVANNKKDRYDAIKKHCCIDFPVASQVVQQRTISKRQMLMSVSTKIAIQLNCKLGGSAWSVEVPVKNLMVIGYDSYHDSSKKGLSVGAVCCSFNTNLTQYYSQVKFQVSSQEMADGLKLNIVAAVRHYHKVNNQMPDRIFIYRDGIGVGDLHNIKEHELPQVLQSFKEVGPNFDPRLTFLVVNKRICTRLFEKQGSQVHNPTPGTIVDNVITRPEFYDFFLVSQAVRQGTVTPTQYNIIHDSSGLRPDHIQRLTYKLTHLYYNWPGTIRVPAPCLYAHKLAFLTGQSLHAVPHQRLADTLFFL